MEQIFYFIAELTVAAGVFYALKWYLKTHQNDFEKRLESYCPPSPLPEARQLYLTNSEVSIYNRSDYLFVNPFSVYWAVRRF